MSLATTAALFRALSAINASSLAFALGLSAGKNVSRAEAESGPASWLRFVATHCACLCIASTWPLATARHRPTLVSLANWFSADTMGATNSGSNQPADGRLSVRRNKAMAVGGCRRRQHLHPAEYLYTSVVCCKSSVWGRRGSVRR